MGGSVQITDIASDERFFSYRAADLLHFELIDWAIGRGCRLFDFGPVRYAGQRRYKKKWGVELREYAHYCFPARKGRAPLSDRSLSMRAARSLWRHRPERARGPGWTAAEAGAGHMMEFEELVAVLRCLDCSGPLRSCDPAGLVCAGCGRAYPVVEGIPAMIEADAEAAVWQGYFRERAENLGDSESANSYFNLRSFRIVKDNLLKLVGPAGRPVDPGHRLRHGPFLAIAGRSEPSRGRGYLLRDGRLRPKEGSGGGPVDGEKAAVRPGTFELVIANNIIQSFRDGGPFVAEAARVLRPEGASS